jgi:Squalene/phytoene synthase
MSLLLSTVRTHDYERYVCTLFAPAKARPHLWSALGLAYELLRIPSSTSEQMVGLVRLKWWQERIAQCFTGTPQDAPPLLLAAAPHLREGIVPLAYYDALCESVAEQIGPTSTLEKVCHTIAAVYRLLAHAAGEAEREEQYALLGARYGNIAVLRTHALREGIIEETLPSMSELQRPVPPTTTESVFFKKLHCLNTLWEARIASAIHHQDARRMQNIPFLALRLAI